MKSEIDALQAELDAARRRQADGGVDPKWPEVPSNYVILAINTKNRIALFAYRRRAGSGGWEVDPIQSSQRRDMESSRFKVARVGPGQVLAIERTTLEARLFG